jgi:hypothetical protein
MTTTPQMMMYPIETSPRVLTEGINKIMDAPDLFTENDADFDCSTAVKGTVVDAISCYKEML